MSLLNSVNPNLLTDVAKRHFYPTLNKRTGYRG